MYVDTAGLNFYLFRNIQKLLRDTNNKSFVGAFQMKSSDISYIYVKWHNHFRYIL